MTETQGTDINETISVAGLAFSAQLTIGAAKWLERVTGKPLAQIGQDMLALGGDKFEVTKVAQLLTALHIAQHPGMDPQEAEAKIDAMTFSEMMEVLGRARPWEFEPKNSRKAPETAPEASTGPESNTT